MDSAQTVTSWCGDWLALWQRFWFHRSKPHTLALVRILGGAMLFYTHAVWTLDLRAFLGRDAWLTPEVTARLHNAASLDSDVVISYAWSFWNYVDSPGLVLTLHLLSLAVFFLLTIGLFSRTVSILACVITLSYCNRLAPAQFGLDQVNAMLATYLMLGPCGAVYSVDRWLAARRLGGAPPIAPTVGANIAVRLMQVHLCVVYLFSGVSKMRGETWWDGSALWHAVSNYEYQSFNVIWLGAFPWFLALMSHATVFWETFYPVLIWPRSTRPIFLGMAFLIHGGIALCMGMITFGTAMIIANLAFLPPDFVEKALSPLAQVVLHVRSRRQTCLRRC